VLTGRNVRWEKLFTYCLAVGTRICGVPPSRFTHSSVLFSHNVGLHPVHSVLPFLLRKRTPCTYSVLLFLIWKRTPCTYLVLLFVIWNLHSVHTPFFCLWSENVYLYILSSSVCDLKMYTLYMLSSSVFYLKTYTLYILSSSICDLKTYILYMPSSSVCDLKNVHPVHTQFFCLYSHNVHSATNVTLRRQSLPLKTLTVFQLQSQLCSAVHSA
jgi:hypothetical protein